jgi:PIN domain nuclease of toxin-antitoxin system
MRLLLDTHILLWAAADQLPAKAAQYIEDRANTLLFSPASLWKLFASAEHPQARAAKRQAVTFPSIFFFFPPAPPCLV